MPERTILVVDDNLDFAESIARLLKMHQWPAIATASVPAALDILDEDRSIALVLADIRMPGVDGFDFRRVVGHRFATLPVILMTGAPVTDDDIIPRNAPILEKPFPIERLLEVIAGSLPSNSE